METVVKTQPRVIKLVSYAVRCSACQDTCDPQDTAQEAVDWARGLGWTYDDRGWWTCPIHADSEEA